MTWMRLHAQHVAGAECHLILIEVAEKSADRSPRALAFDASAFRVGTEDDVLRPDSDIDLTVCGDAIRQSRIDAKLVADQNGSFAVGGSDDGSRNQIHIAHEIGDEPVGRLGIDFMRRSELLQLAVVDDGIWSESASASAWSWVT